MKLIHLLFLSCCTVFFGCGKQKLSQERLAGNWKFDEYTYVEINEEPGDSKESFSKVIPANGYLNLDQSGNGTANWPIVQDYDPASIYYNDSLPAMYESAVQVLVQPDSKKYNGKDYGMALVSGKFIAFKLLAKNKLNIIIFGDDSWNKNNRYTRITLTK